MIEKRRDCWLEIVGIFLHHQFAQSGTFAVKFASPLRSEVKEFADIGGKFALTRTGRPDFDFSV
jgi:hypothetical protein